MQWILDKRFGNRVMVDPVTNRRLFEELRLELVVLLVEFGQTGQSDLLSHLVHLFLQRDELAVHQLRRVQVPIPVLFTLLDHGFHRIDVGMDLTQLFHVSVFLLHQVFQLLPEVLQTVFLSFRHFDLRLHSCFQLFQLSCTCPVRDTRNHPLWSVLPEMRSGNLLTGCLSSVPTWTWRQLVLLSPKQWTW